MKKFTKKTKIITVLSILYFILPEDLIPDYIIGFGQIDDLAVLGYMYKCIRKDLKTFKNK